MHRPSRRAWLCVLLLGVVGGGVRPALAGDRAPPDALDEALALASLTRADLGWRAEGWWDRYPQDIPYKMRHFDDLCAHPRALVPWVRSMGTTVRTLLTPEALEGKGPDGKGVRGAGALFRLVHDLGVHRRYGATRAYGANLATEPVALADALLRCWTDLGRPTKLVTFGQEAPYPAIEADVREAASKVPVALGAPIGRLIADLLDARRWVERAFRNVPLEKRAAVARRVDLGAEETDALDYEPAMDDVAHAWDEPSLGYGALKVVEALDRARLSLNEALAASGALAAAKFGAIEIDTPAGLVRIAGTGSDEHSIQDAGAFLVLDLGGDDRYEGPVAASNPGLYVAASLDLGGDDAYALRKGSALPCQGAGVVGVGVCLDAAGNDAYDGQSLCQGAGHFGLGALIDLQGDDVRHATYSAQGAGFFGVGLLVDAAGKDQYVAWSDVQGFGGVAGVGVLADARGDDVYEAVVDPAITKRPSYHTDKKVSVSNAQGCAMGRRGDGADGHSWAGGIGALLDAEGDDRMTCANWGQGCGYWFGTGILWDGAGNDVRTGNGWTGASGAHFCIGALVDEAGNDSTTCAQNWGPAYGHDFTLAILADLQGDDAYHAGAAGIGWSINRSVALLLDASGNDAYDFRETPKLPGTAVFDARFLDRRAPGLYWTESVSVGLLLDTGGKDAYPTGFADGESWTDAPGSDNAKARNRGIRVDREGGSLPLD